MLLCIRARRLALLAPPSLHTHSLIHYACVGHTWFNTRQICVHPLTPILHCLFHTRTPSLLPSIVLSILIRSFLFFIPCSFLPILLLFIHRSLVVRFHIVSFLFPPYSFFSCVSVFFLCFLQPSLSLCLLLSFLPSFPCIIPLLPLSFVAKVVVVVVSFPIIHTSNPTLGQNWSSL